MKNLLRNFSRVRPLLKDKTFEIPMSGESTELGSSERKSNEMFNKIFDSVFESAEARQKKNAAAAINQMFAPKPIYTPRSASTAPISLIREKCVLSKKTQKLEYLKPVYDHINALGSNVQVVDYFLGVAVPNFDKNCAKWDTPTPEGPFAPKTLGPVFHQCLEALLALNDPMGVLAMFSNVKNCDQAVVEAALTAPVYNTIIALYWEFYRDFKQCFDIASEMSLRAVAGDASTANLILDITQEAQEAKRADSKESVLLWDQRDNKLMDLMISHRRNIVDLIADREGMPRTNFSA